MAKLSQNDIKRVKAMGFLWNRGTEQFSARAITENGTMTAAQLHNIAACAEKYGNGTVAFTTRLTVEMPGIAFANVEAVKAHVAKEGLIIGGTGNKLRPVAPCKGTTCVYGNCDTQGIAKEIHQRYFLGWADVQLPHKFKVAVGGCPNSCMKPSLNDFGIQGHRAPRFDASKCKGCGVCVIEKDCPMKAARVANSVLHIDESVCSSCGVCSGKCPFGTLPRSEEPVFRIYVGGTWGKHTRVANPLSRMVSQEEIFLLLEKSLLWFRENAYQKERFGAAIDRVGFEALERALFSDDLLKRKAEILASPIRER